MKNGFTNTYCDPSFFVSKHRQHSSPMTDDSHIEHMIPHHQVAVDMSKILLENTNSDMMIWFAYRIIKEQQEVMVLDTLKNQTIDTRVI
jgi:uncharacterized protein (DUF305 family)